jgi:hypothetical protein
MQTAVVDHPARPAQRLRHQPSDQSSVDSCTPGGHRRMSYSGLGGNLVFPPHEVRAYHSPDATYYPIALSSTRKLTTKYPQSYPAIQNAPTCASNIWILGEFYRGVALIAWDHYGKVRSFHTPTDSHMCPVKLNNNPRRQDLITSAQQRTHRVISLTLRRKGRHVTEPSQPPGR